MLKEIWIAELVKAFRSEPSFLSTLPDYSSKVADNNTLHMSDVGADPQVLINNTTYPIAVAARVDSDLAISLDKFDTTNTEVTDDELKSLAYDKIKSINEQHKEVLTEKTADKAAHALSPQANTTDTPLIDTTGATNGNPTPRKKMTLADIISAKGAFDVLKIPRKGRVLILCNEHVQDLLNVNEAFQKQYNMDNKEGLIGRLYGFDIYEYATMPVFAVGTTKQAFGAAAVATDRAASIFYYAPRMFKAMGKTTLYSAKAENDPQNRKSVIGYRTHFVAMPKKAAAIGAIVGANL